jgi:hypothetical protein
LLLAGYERKAEDGRTWLRDWDVFDRHGKVGSIVGDAACFAGFGDLR